MTLSAALSNATGGLAVIARDLALISQNVANAATPGYAREIAAQQSITADGQGMGVRSLPESRAVDVLLAQASLDQSATVAGLSARQTALQAIDAVRGTPGQGGDLASAVGALADAFSKLDADPSNSTQQIAVVQAAGTLATGVRTLSDAYGAQRQGAQTSVVEAVASINAGLGTIGSLTNQIIALKAKGLGTADLENQRDAAVQTLGQFVSVKAIGSANGDIQLYTGGGAALPIRGAPNPLATADASTGPTASYPPPGGIPAITLGGADVTRQLAGGSLGAAITLRDTTLPTFQAQLDEFSQGLASRFDAQGLRLFTDGAGAVPAGGGVPSQAGYIGFSAALIVNAAVIADPSLTRDGTHAVAGSATGASAFATNPVGGPAGFQTLIQRVLDFSLGPQAQAGVPQAAFNATGLGPTGALASGYSSPTSLGGLASALTAAQSATSAAATTKLGTESAVQTGLQARIQTTSGVSIDTEMASMVALQTAYGANAKIITATQALWSQLLASVN